MQHYDKDAEIAVIASMMKDNANIPRCLEILNQGDAFVNIPHQIIYKVIQSLWEDGKPCDVVSVGNQLNVDGDLNRIGSVQYLHDVFWFDAVPENLEYYAKLVQELSVRRQLIACGPKIQQIANEDIPIEEMQSKAQELVTSITTNLDKEVGIKQQADNAYERLNKMSDGLHIELSTGFTNLDLMLSGLQKKKYYIIAGLPSVGKCLTGDTEIVCYRTGYVKTVKEIYEEKMVFLTSLNEKWELVEKEPTDYIDNGRQEVYELTTSSGRNIKVTEAHQFLTINGWKPLNELKIGEHIATPRVMPTCGLDAMPEAEIKILAYLIGDGGLTSGAPRFVNGNMDLVLDFSNAVSRVSHPQMSFLGDNGMRVNQHGKKNRSAPTYAVVGGDGFNVVEYLCKKHGVWNKLAVEKEIPKAIFTCPKNQVALFLNRLYACDGSAYVSKDGSYGIDYSTSSPVLAKQVHHLLLRFGIISTLRSRKMKYKNTYRPTYNVVILGKGNVRLFADEIGIFSKEAKLEEVYNIARKKDDGFTRDVIPCEASQYIREAKEKDGRMWVELGKYLEYNQPKNACMLGRKKRRKHFSRSLLTSVANFYDDYELNIVAYSDVFWDKIKSIEYVGVEQVYDLEIPGTHNFVANDIIVHNSAFVHNLLYHVGVELSRPAALFCYESDAPSVILRMVSMATGIDFFENAYKSKDNEKVVEVFSRIQQSPLIILDDMPFSVEHAVAKAQRLKVEHPDLSLIVFDHIHEMTADVGKYGNQEAVVSTISGNLKRLAKIIDIPVVALCQMSRASIKQQNPRPMLNDLRASGALEFGADVVVFVYRDDYYEPTTPSPISDTEIIIRKNRDGPVGTLKYQYYRATSRFEEV